MELFQYAFFQNALIGSLFTCIACGIVGSYIVVRRLVFISGGITHASFGGLGLGFFLGVNPIVSALVFSVSSAFGVEWLSKKQGVREDSAIAALWALGMALGVICIFLTPGYAPNISSYLFGNILTVTSADIWFIGVFAILVCLLFALFFKPIMFTAFDREFAKTQRVKVELIEHLMMVAIAICIVASIRLIGIMLLMSLLTVPQMTANLFTSQFKNMILYSIAIGILGCFAGLFLSYYLNVPSGASIIFVQVIIFFVCKALTFLPLKTIKPR
ncbi:zinc transport system permease protein [Dysgonomonadaceae bacterium PH5-43]|nr:zinc transport system permease protein [Dysgonomonadaceae bacterium PH5-43]